MLIPRIGTADPTIAGLIVLAARWKGAIGSRRDVTVHSYPALNHLFIAGTGASLPAEYQIPGHVAEEVIRDIATWIMTSR